MRTMSPLRRLTSTGRLAALPTNTNPPFVSLYQKTHRHHPDKAQDPIRFRNSLRDLESLLKDKHPTREIVELLERFSELSHDGDFWNHRTDGLAILASPGVFEVFDLQRPVRDLLVVADSFHTKPMLRVLQSADRYQILCLNRHDARLFEGNRDSLDRVELDGVPTSITEALGDQLTEPHAGMRSSAGGGGGQGAVHYGYGQRRDEIDVDLERFFRVIDRAIMEQYSKPTGLPLILAALPEYHSAFREISKNSYLAAEGAMVNPDALDIDELRRVAWDLMQPHYLDRLAKLVDTYHASRARDLGTDMLSDVAVAAVNGRVDTLLVEADRFIPGAIDRQTGEIQLSEGSDSAVDDVLDDLAEEVLRNKGDVVVVPAARMPTTSGAAATFRY